MTRAVVFDLWDTLVDYVAASGRTFLDDVAERLGHDPDEFEALWRDGHSVRETGPLVGYLTSIGIGPAEAEEIAALRREWTRAALVPRAGAVETLEELRDRGIGTALLSVCSEDVPAVWPESPFAGLFGAEIFSCEVGLMKPDPRVYRLACERLEVEPADAVFVGDGANDELAGAERAGLRAVLIHRPGEEPHWPAAREWEGPRITSIPDVLHLL